jgi:hypothetical protein
VTADATLILAWLVLAHLTADFLLQTESMVADKFTAGRRGWRGLLAHGAAVAVCLVPVAAAYAVPGLVLLVVVTIGHVVIDRWKVRATRRAEGRALAAARRRHETASTTGLGPAWTPIPGALFVVDQAAHLVVIGIAWIALLAATPLAPAWVDAMTRIAAGLDPAAFHHVVLVGVVLVSLAIVNIRAGALFVATLVRPRETVTGHDDTEQAATTVEPVPVAANPGQSSVTTSASPARLGATIGVLERLLIVTFVLTGSSAAVGFVVAAKTLARFKQLDDRDFAEYYLLGTLASVAVAVASGLVAHAALATLK